MNDIDKLAKEELAKILAKRVLDEVPKSTAVSSINFVFAESRVDVVITSLDYKDEVEGFIPKSMHKVMLNSKSEADMLSSLGELATRIEAGEHPIRMTAFSATEKEGLFHLSDEASYVDMRRVERMRLALREIAEDTPLDPSRCADIAEKALRRE